MNVLVIYIYNWLVLVSKAVNVVFGGSPHESLSMRVGRKYYTERKRNWWINAQKNIINAIFWFEDNHILDAVNGEDTAKDLWDGWQHE